jgi:hypothetical protein
MRQTVKRFLRLALRWGVPPLLAIAAFAAGYLVLYPGLAGNDFSDGSARSFEETAGRISEGNLLEKASPLERVQWLLEICKQPRSIKRDDALFSAIQQMQPSDFMAAITDLPELARQMGAMESDLRAELIQAGIERWMDVDEAGLLRWLPVARNVLESDTWKLPKIGERDLGAIYAVLAQRKPGWMFEQIKELGPKMERTAAARAVIQSAVEAGLPQAEAWLASFKDQAEYLPARRTYLRAIAKADPERALTLALAEPTGSPDFATELICECGLQKPDLATSMLEKLDEKQRISALQKLAAVIASDPSYDAFKWLDDQMARTPQLLEANDTSYLASLTARDAPRTMEWVQKLPEARRETMTRSVLQVWMNTEPKTLLDWLNAHPDAHAFEKFDYFGALPAADPEGFRKWIATMPPGEVQRKAQSSLASQMLYAGRFADAARIFPMDPSDISPIGFSYQFAQANPVEASRWLENLPPGQMREKAAFGVLGHWLNAAPEEATHWVENLPQGGMRDTGAGIIIQNILGKDFDGANAWLAEIQDQGARDQAAARIYNGWRGQSPARTREWLRALPGVSDTMRNRLLRK